jgi:hypothetical protein
MDQAHVLCLDRKSWHDWAWMSKGFLFFLLGDTLFAFFFSKLGDKSLIVVDNLSLIDLISKHLYRPKN